MNFAFQCCALRAPAKADLCGLHTSLPRCLGSLYPLVQLLVLIDRRVGLALRPLRPASRLRAKVLGSNGNVVRRDPEV